VCLDANRTDAQQSPFQKFKVLSFSSLLHCFQYDIADPSKLRNRSEVQTLLSNLCKINEIRIEAEVQSRLKLLCVAVYVRHSGVSSSSLKRRKMLL